MVFELGDLYVPLGVVADNFDEDSDSKNYKPQDLLAHYCIDKTQKPRQRQQKSPRELELATETLLKKLAIATHPDQQIRLIATLATYDPSHPEIPPNLLNALMMVHRKSSLKLVTETLPSLSEYCLPIMLPKVRDIYLNSATHSPNKRACYKLLWDWSKSLSYSDFQHLWQTEH